MRDISKVAQGQRLSARQFNAVVEQANRTGRIIAEGPLEVLNTAAGVNLRFNPPAFWAQLTDSFLFSDGNIAYSWQEMISTADGTGNMMILAGGRSGLYPTLPAFEVNNFLCPVGLIVRMRPGGTLQYSFEAIPLNGYTGVVSQVTDIVCVDGFEQVFFTDFGYVSGSLQAVGTEYFGYTAGCCLCTQDIITVVGCDCSPSASSTAFSCGCDVPLTLVISVAVSYQDPCSCSDEDVQVPLAWQGGDIWAGNAPVQCNDGTISVTMTCNGADCLAWDFSYTIEAGPDCNGDATAEVVSCSCSPFCLATENGCVTTAPNSCGCPVYYNQYKVTVSGITDQSVTNPGSSCPAIVGLNGTFLLDFKGDAQCIGAPCAFWQTSDTIDLATCVDTSGVNNPCTDGSPDCPYVVAPKWTFYAADGSWTVISGDVCGWGNPFAPTICVGCLTQENSFGDTTGTLYYEYTGSMLNCDGQNSLTYGGQDGPNSRGSTATVTIEPILDSGIVSGGSSSGSNCPCGSSSSSSSSSSCALSDSCCGCVPEQTSAVVYWGGDSEAVSQTFTLNYGSGVWTGSGAVSGNACDGQTLNLTLQCLSPCSESGAECYELTLAWVGGNSITLDYNDLIGFASCNPFTLNFNGEGFTGPGGCVITSVNITGPGCDCAAIPPSLNATISAGSSGCPSCILGSYAMTEASGQWTANFTRTCDEYTINGTLSFSCSSSTVGGCRQYDLTGSLTVSVGSGIPSTYPISASPTSCSCNPLMVVFPVWWSNPPPICSPTNTNPLLVTITL